MDKKKVNALIPIAYEVLKAEFSKGEIPSEFRGYFSAVGAAITTGSLLSAIAFVSRKSESTAEARHKVPGLILNVFKSDNEIKEETLFDYVRKSDDQKMQEQVLNATLALKLALNLFELKKKEESSPQKGDSDGS